MNRKIEILSGALLLILAAGIFHSCAEEDFGMEPKPDKETLIAQGRYLTARSADSFVLVNPDKEPATFEMGTPYRLFAFAKPYLNEESNTTSRFNKVAWEGETPDGLHYFNLDSDPDKWFGFSALEGETAGSDGLVTLDFYGFTYGKKQEDRAGYIPVEGWTDDGKADPQNITRTEVVVNESDTTYLPDLMRGVLLDQNIFTAGVKPDDPSTEANEYTQSVMPFAHCFSKLRFQVSQQEDKDKKDADGNPTPAFGPDLFVDNIVVTGTYPTGTVNLSSGKVEVSGEKMGRTLPFTKNFRETKSNRVTTTNTDIGNMIIFPSDGNDLSNSDLADGYDIGLEITVRSSTREHISNMIQNTGGDINAPGAITEVTEGSTTWYKGTIVKPNIIDYLTPNPDNTNPVLHFKQNTSYMLIIVFQKDAVRIITVIPMVEEWLPGEWNEKGEPWQDQALGQPQMFDNIVWSDRNLGADHFDATGLDYEKTIGYYYQPHRNIPYFPFNVYDYYEKDPTTGKPSAPMTEVPTPEVKRKKNLYVTGSYSSTTHKVYPMVDESILNMMHQKYGKPTNGDWTFKANGSDFTWVVPKDPFLKNETNYYKNRPQMDIPETKPTNTYFDFYDGIWNDDNMHWDEGQQNQPVKGSWIVPSSKDFLTIFPSTPYAGNFAFRGGGMNSFPMQGWGTNSNNQKTANPIPADRTTLRVTVPFYYDGMEAPGKTEFNGKDVNEKAQAKAKYEQAWNILKKHKNSDNKRDPGTTHLNDNTYSVNPDYTFVVNKTTYHNLDIEPNGDPADGYASVYVISRDGDNLQELPPAAKSNKYQIQSWGTIYAIKRIYTSQAYRMRWRVRCAEGFGTSTQTVPAFYVEICRYRCNADDELTEDNYMNYDWDHPAATIYFPMCGIVEKGFYYNFGTECLYATSDALNTSGSAKVSVVQMKVTGDDPSNVYISVLTDMVDRNFGMQIRPIMGGGNKH